VDHSGPFEVVGISPFPASGGLHKENSAMSVTAKTTRPKSLRTKMQSPEVDLGFRWGRANTLLLASGVAVLAAGYVTLHQGSLTLAPALLVIGYCVLIPAALLVRSGEQGTGE